MLFDPKRRPKKISVCLGLYPSPRRIIIIEMHHSGRSRESGKKIILFLMYPPPDTREEINLILTPGTFHECPIFAQNSGSWDIITRKI